MSLFGVAYHKKEKQKFFRYKSSKIHKSISGKYKNTNEKDESEIK